MPIKLEIESVFNVAKRGTFVGVRLIDPSKNFRVTEKSFLGGVELERFLDIPRSIDANGRQRIDIAFLQLKNPDDKGKLIPGSIVEIMPGDEIHFLEPWYKLELGNLDLEKELYTEVSKSHILFGKKLNAIAKRSDKDDALFELIDSENKFAVVHLTWARKEESNSKYPQTRIFKDWLDLYNNCIVPDHNEFNL
jgi:hypothetical protein